MSPAAVIDRLAARRAELVAELEDVHRRLLDEVVGAIGKPGVNVRALAKRAGIARATVYNELERRAKVAEHADTVEGNGHPTPAPHDADELDARGADTNAGAAGRQENTHP